MRQQTAAAAPEKGEKGVDKSGRAVYFEIKMPPGGREAGAKRNNNPYFVGRRPECVH